jgi:hypothetical protein
MLAETLPSAIDEYRGGRGDGDLDDADTGAGLPDEVMALLTA